MITRNKEIRTGVGKCIDILLYNELFLEDLFEKRGTKK
jgi:hypothetical protein